MNVAIKQPSQRGDNIGGAEEGVKVEGHLFGKKNII